MFAVAAGVESVRRAGGGRFGDLYGGIDRRGVGAVLTVGGRVRSL
jgi:hypothetical protein